DPMLLFSPPALLGPPGVPASPSWLNAWGCPLRMVRAEGRPLPYARLLLHGRAVRSCASRGYLSRRAASGVLPVGEFHGVFLPIRLKIDEFGIPKLPDSRLVRIRKSAASVS